MKLKYFLILGIFLLSLNFVSASWCYQENTNSSTAGDGTCGLNYTGNYQIYNIIQITNSSKFFDKDWATYANAAVGSYAYINITYYKPANSTSANWQIKDYSTTSPINISLSSSCFNAYSNKIVLRAYAGTCFLNETKIKTLLGEKEIKDIKINDYVLSYNEDFKLNVYSKVTEVFNHSSEDYLIINNELKVTSNHEMFINDEWKEIGKAKIGDNLKDYNGNNILINSINKINNSVEVYNLEVDNTHNYYADDYLVHNKAAQSLYYCFFSGTWNQIRTSGYTTRYDWYEEAIAWNITSSSPEPTCWNYNSTSKILSIPNSCFTNNMVKLNEILSQVDW